jgi:hypothetical protein
MKSRCFLLIPLLLLISCSSDQYSTKDKELDKVYKMIRGSYNSSMQNKIDSSYYNISLEMHPVWKDSGERWLYVERALASQKDQPYRVSMYKLVRKDDNAIVCEVYTIPNEKKYYGKFKNPKAFQYLTPEYLELREGCEITIKKDKDGFYSGATGKNSCLSVRNGATYTTSLVLIREYQFISWDRGFDADGNQIWGAEKGGYIFNKGSLRDLDYGDINLD